MSVTFRNAMFAAPALGWLVILLAGFGLQSLPLTGVVLIGVVAAAVHHAETIAHRVGEPFGTLILALAVTVIEVGLILALMLAHPETSSELARDTIFAAAMIILNLLLGLCLMVSARHQDEARFTRTGATAALGTLSTLMVLTLVLPNFTTSVAGPVFSYGQLAFVAAFSLLLYLTFVFVQTVASRDYFLPAGAARLRPETHAAPPSVALSWASFAALIASLGAVVLLAKLLSVPIQTAVDALGAPKVVVGIAIAAMVLLPEGIAAVRAARANRIQTSLNLALGSALATTGLTIPAVAVASWLLDLPIALGLDAKSMVLLALTLFVAGLSLARGRITLLHGAVHLTIFAAYLMVSILP